MKPFLKLLISCSIFFLSTNVGYCQKTQIDTTLQQDSFRTLDWMADSVSKAIMSKKQDGVVSLYPGAGIYLKYGRIVAPEIPFGSSISRYSYFKLRLAKNHKKLQKSLKKAGLSFNKVEFDRVEIDTGTNEQSIVFCKIRSYYKRNKARFFVETYGIMIDKQWFLIDGFNLERKEDI